MTKRKHPKPSERRPRKEPELHKGETAMKRVETAFQFALRGGSVSATKKP